MLPFDQSWGEDFFFIRDLKKLNWNLHEYITYKQASIYLFVGSLTQNMSNLRLAIYLTWEVILSDFGKK